MKGAFNWDIFVCYSAILTNVDALYICLSNILNTVIYNKLTQLYMV